ncbi:phage portal protein [Bacillus sp. AFS017336]|nr:phage portal protein [Bacillus sp. AFS017336]
MEKMISEKAISGTWGEAWVDGEKFGEVYGLQANGDIVLEDVPMCGVASGKGKKFTGVDYKGSIRFNKVNSKLVKKISDGIKARKIPYFTIVSKLADPAAYGAERVALYNCIFTSIPLADWEASKLVQSEMPFVFEDHSFLDVIKESK